MSALDEQDKVRDALAKGIARENGLKDKVQEKLDGYNAEISAL